MVNTDLKRDYFKYVSLNVLGMIGLSCYILADTFFVAKALGTVGLASLNFAIPLYNVISGIGLMLGMGGGIKYTLLRAQSRSEQANGVFTCSLLSGICVGTLIAILALLFAQPCAKLLGAQGDTLPLTVLYLRTMLSFAPFFIANNILLAFIRNDHNPRLAMIAMLSGSLSNILLDYIFMFPMGMGMFGAAFATGLAPIISLLVLSAHFRQKKNGFSLSVRPLKMKNLLNIMSLGTSYFITEISSAVVLITFNLIIARLEGSVGVAAYGIIANLSLVVVAIFSGIAQGTQPLLSRSFGLSQQENIKKLLRYALITALVFSAFVYLVSVMNSAALIGIFNSENDGYLCKLAAVGIKIYFLGFFFAGLNILLSAFFSAAELPRQAFIISSARGIFIILPVVLLLSTLFEITGVWLSFTVTELLTSLVAFVLLYCYKNKSKNIGEIKS